MKYIFQYKLLVALLLPALFIACKKDFPSNVESPDKVVLQSIQIVNAGQNGNTVLEGVIDENAKTIWFPRLDTLTDFSNIRFEAVTSNGAKLEKESYTWEFAEGASAKTQVIKVINNKRFREYMVTLRLIVPVFGADFTKSTVFDHTNNDLGHPVYPTFASLLTRGTGFDGEHVLIVTRAAEGSHLLKVSDLRNNKVVPIPLNLTGVGGGTFPVNTGAQVHGHTYIASLSGSQASPLRIYHWTNPANAPEMIADIKVSAIPDAGTRHGDNMSVNLDENGNGYIYFGDNAVKKILRLKVENFTEVSDPKVFDNASGSTFVMSFNRVGNTSDYIYTGYDAPVRLANESAVVSYSMTNADIPVRGSDARVFKFNGERYLMLTTAARTGSDAVVLYVYNITSGETTAEALQKLNEKGSEALVFQYSLQGPVNIAPSTQTGFYVTKNAEGKDEKLTLFTASADAGFVVIDFPQKTLDD